VAHGRNSQFQLLAALAGATPADGLYATLHEQAVTAVGGRSAILFQLDPGGEWLHPVSAYGRVTLPGESVADTAAAAKSMFRGGSPVFVARAKTLVPGLASPSAILVPLIYMDDRLGVLAVGCTARPSARVLARLSPVGHAFALALRLERWRQAAQFQQGLKTLFEEFSRSVSSPSRLAAALEALCVGTNRLFGAQRSTVWLYDRRAGMMNVAASSDSLITSGSPRVSATDARAPAAIALRRDRSDIVPHQESASHTGTITIPLRGRRRALGALLVDGVGIGRGMDRDLLTCADEMGAHLSAAIESVLLLDELIASGAGLARVSRDPDAPSSERTGEAAADAEGSDLRNKAIQTEKLAALGQFVAGIAHELNNPLQAVLGHLELMRATGAFPRPLRRDVQRIYREADRAAKIVRNLLVFAGSRRLVRRRVSVSTALTRIFSLRGPSLRAEGIEVIRRRDETLPRLKADPLLLQQALLNIVLNAEHAIGLDGRIETTETLLADPPRLLIEIRDTGPGFPPGVLPRIFEPFYTTKEVGKGTGLGLAITYGIIQEHGGQISAANHPEGGALFTIHLPVEPAREPG
jgi:signal transduction histidine kinase